MDGAKSFEGRRSLDKAKKGGRRRRIKDILITAMRVSTKAEEEGRAFSGGVVCYNKVYETFVCDAKRRERDTIQKGEDQKRKP